LGYRNDCRVNAGIVPRILYFSTLCGACTTDVCGIGNGIQRLPKLCHHRSGDTTGPNKARPRSRALAAVTLVLGLAGCGTISDEVASRVITAPGRYSVYPCPNIEQLIKSVSQRRTELEQLMARSAQSPGGELVNAMAYRSEYLQTGGELEELAKASAEKKCAIESKSSSGRTVY
jgi:hypothetical protein